LDWAKLQGGGGNVNALTSERLTDIGAGATFYSTLVEARKAECAGDRPTHNAESFSRLHGAVG
jgi:hypothetical protein